MSSSGKLNILGITGSLRKNASSTRILIHIQRLLPHSLSFELYADIGTLPHFDDSVIAPQSVELLRNKIRDADGVIICQPEYAFGVSGSLKNALDWTVGSGEFSGKPVALITAATGGDNAHAALLKTLQAIDCRLNDDTNYLISFVKAKMDTEGHLKDKQTDSDLQDLLRRFTDRLLVPSQP